MEVVHVGGHVQAEKSPDVVALEKEDENSQKSGKSGGAWDVEPPHANGSPGGDGHGRRAPVPGHTPEEFNHGPGGHETVGGE